VADEPDHTQAVKNKDDQLFNQEFKFNEKIYRVFEGEKEFTY